MKLFAGDCASGWSDLQRAIAADPEELASYGETHQPPPEQTRPPLRELLRQVPPTRVMIRHLQAFIERQPHLGCAWAWRGIMRRRMHDYPGAIEDIDRAEALGVRWAALRTWRGEAKFRLSDFSGGRADFEAAFQLPCQDWNYAEYGRALIQQCHDGEGVRYLDKALALSPGSGWHYAWRAMAKCRLRRYEGMFEDFDRALDLLKSGRRFIETHAWRGIARLQAGDMEQAIADFDFVISQLPDYGPAWFHRGRAYRRLGRLRDWFEDLMQAVRLEGGKHIHNATAGGAEAVASTLSDLDVLLKQSPKWPQARWWRGMLRAQSARLPEALEDLDAAIRLGIRHSTAYSWRAEVRGDLGDAQGAMQDFGRALRLDPSNGQAWVGRGRLLLARSREREAAKALEKSRAFGLHSDRLYALRGSLWMMLGRFEDGVKDLRSAERLMDRSPLIHADLSFALGRLSDAASQKSHLDAALRLGEPAARARLKLWEDYFS